MKADTDDPTQEALRSLESELGVRSGFLIDILGQGDDWSFIIKLHALFEAALAHCLTKELGRPELSNVFAQTELSRSNTGKVEFAKALGMTTSKERRYLRSLSELRNDLVHDVTNTTFSFATYLGGMTPDQRSAFYERFEIDVEGDHVEIKGRRIPRETFFLDNPRLMIWVAATVVLEYWYVHTKGTSLRRELETLQAESLRRWGHASPPLLPEPE